MQIDFVKFNSELREHCELMAKWENDPDLRFLLGWTPNEEASRRITTPEMVRERTSKPAPSGVFGERYMITCNNKIIGDVVFCIGAPQVISKNCRVAWLGIGIGEKSFQGKGIGKTAMAFIEKRARNAGAELFELGVFEFNGPALKLYNRLGYKEIKRIPEFTWYNGKMWSDIRMTKSVNETVNF